MSKLSEIAIKRAKEELHETDDTRCAKLEDLRRKVIAEKAVSCPTDDGFLLRFLRHRKFNVDAALQRIIDYYTVRAANRDIFDNLTPSQVKHVLEAGVPNILPQRDCQGRKIWVHRPGLFPYSKYNVIDMIRTNAVIMDKLLEDEETQVCGIRFVVDFTGLTMGHMTSGHISPAYFRKTKVVTEQSYPIRMGAIDIINGGAIFGYFFKIISTIMGKKMLDRAQNHSSLDSLVASVCADGNGGQNTDLLPAELGGTGAFSLPNVEFYSALLEDEDVFVQRNKHHIVDFANLGQASKQGVVAGGQGTVGSIRKINTD